MLTLILSLYTLQFLPLWKRKQVLQRIYKGLVEGGAFILVEKIRAENSMFEDIWTDLYWDFKQDSGLNEQQVIKKSQSLRGGTDAFNFIREPSIIIRHGVSVYGHIY